MRTVAVFGMPEAGHFQRLRPLIDGLAGRGIEVQVFTDPRFAERVIEAGGRFVDLFDGRPLDEADHESIPFPCRYVSFAGRYADDVIRELEARQPSLIIYDTFAVVGRIAALAMGIPGVNVCAGHNMDPNRVEALIENHPRVQISDRCHRAVQTLRDRYGLGDATPFSYLTGISAILNLYCEPEQYLTEAERRVFEPVAFFGSLPAAGELADRDLSGGPSPFSPADSDLRVYICFGTVVWRYWTEAALSALAALSDALAERDGTEAVISLGGAEIDADIRRALERPSVAVADHVDQWLALGEADAFVTHHGLNSTHEAVYQKVPMLSYPFFTDQPLLAQRCSELGLSIPLVDFPREALTEERIESELEELLERREPIRAALSEAHEWELQTIAGRAAILDRIASLAG